MKPVCNVGLQDRALTARRAFNARLLLSLALSGLGAFAAESASAQTMLGSIRAGWSTYIFVATGMPHESLVALARHASVNKNKSPAASAG